MFLHYLHVRQIQHRHLKSTFSSQSLRSNFTDTDSIGSQIHT